MIIVNFLRLFYQSNMKNRFTYRIVAEVDVDGIVVVEGVDVVVGNVVVDVVVVHFISQSSASDPSISLHFVPLFFPSWTIVRFLRVKPLPSTHSQSDHVDH